MQMRLIILLTKIVGYAILISLLCNFNQSHLHIGPAQGTITRCLLTS